MEDNNSDVDPSSDLGPLPFSKDEIISDMSAADKDEEENEEANEANEANETLSQLLSSLNQHDEPPWTIQRISEILAKPNQLYKTTRKLCFALDKLLQLG